MNKIKVFKEILNVNSSEKLFGFPEQPPDTCGMIDEVIDKNKDDINSIECQLRGTSSCNEEELRIRLDDIESVIGWAHLTDDCEKIRDNVIALRSWGQQWKDLAIHLFNTYAGSGELDSDMIDRLKKNRCGY